MASPQDPDTLHPSPQSMLHPPLFCAICAAPCLQPRASEAVRPHLDRYIGGTDTTDAKVVDDSHTDLSWEHYWQVLIATKGISTTYTISPSSAPVSEPTEEKTQKREPRAVPIHDACLTKLLSTIRRSVFNNGFSHEENMMLGWSIPKWTGYGPWVNQAIPRDGTVEWFGGMGYWAGTVDQRKRFKTGVVGSHLVSLDHHSPDDLGMPTHAGIQTALRPRQTSGLLQLPADLLVHIALHILDLDEVAPTPVDPTCKDKPNTPISVSDLVSVDSVRDFLSFTRVCSITRYLDVPSSIWSLITLHSAQRFQLECRSRWKASPTGAGASAELWIALDEDIITPLKIAFAQTRYLSSPSTPPLASTTTERYSSKDVWRWWAYSPGWRSKRRIWHCVVHAAATARDADWCDQFSSFATSWY